MMYSEIVENTIKGIGANKYCHKSISLISFTPYPPFKLHKMVEDIAEGLNPSIIKTKSKIVSLLSTRPI